MSTPTPSTALLMLSREQQARLQQQQQQQKQRVWYPSHDTRGQLATHILHDISRAARKRKRENKRRRNDARRAMAARHAAGNQLEHMYTEMLALEDPQLDPDRFSHASTSGDESASDSGDSASTSSVATALIDPGSTSDVPAIDRMFNVADEEMWTLRLTTSTGCAFDVYNKEIGAQMQSTGKGRLACPLLRTVWSAAQWALECEQMLRVPTAYCRPVMLSPRSHQLRMRSPETDDNGARVWWVVETQADLQRFYNASESVSAMIVKLVPTSPVVTE